MKPHRIRMTHSLIMNYRLYKKMEIYVSPPERFAVIRALLKLSPFPSEQNRPPNKKCANSTQMNTLIFCQRLRLITWNNIPKSKGNTMSETIAQYSTVCSSFAAFPGAAVWKALQDSTVENAILRLIGPVASTMRKRAKHLGSAT